jgi:hypothetical protein
MGALGDYYNKLYDYIYHLDKEELKEISTITNDPDKFITTIKDIIDTNTIPGLILSSDLKFFKKRKKEDDSYVIGKFNEKILNKQLREKYNKKTNQWEYKIKTL